MLHAQEKRRGRLPNLYEEMQLHLLKHLYLRSSFWEQGPGIWVFIVARSSSLPFIACSQGETVFTYVALFFAFSKAALELFSPIEKYKQIESSCITLVKVFH